MSAHNFFVGGPALNFFTQCGRGCDW